MTDEKKPEVKQEPVKQELNVQALSHRQLTSELKRRANAQYSGKGFVMNGADFGDVKIKNRAGIGNAYATVLEIVSSGTRTAPVFEFHDSGTPKRVARKDQIGNGKLNNYPI